MPQALRVIILLFSAVLLLGTSAVAAEGCEIEDFNFKELADSLYISGATTCREGKLTLRVYNGKGEFLAADFTYIRGFAFQTYIDSPVPKELRLKYTIDAG